MKTKKLELIASLVALVSNVFITGTLIYFAVDVFALYSENQFTGRMRSFDVDYWNAVGGAALLLVPGRLFSIFSKYRKKDDGFQAALEKVLDRDADILRRLAESDGELPPPKKPPFYN